MKEIKIPKVGMGVTEVEISKWLVNNGDKVNKGDPLVEITTEKINTVLDSSYAGIVRNISAKEGEMIEVGSLICNIE